MPEMKARQRADMTIDQRLEKIEQTLDRMCAELDIAINALKVLLEHAGLVRKAQAIGEDLDQLHAEREES